MYGTELQERLRNNLDEIRSAGLFKGERVITSPQGAHIEVGAGQESLNLCANNYLGLASHPEIVAAARQALDDWGYGLSSVRFICGTQAPHKQLEEALSSFLGMEDTILYSSCFDANGGLFVTLLGAEDAVISDELNHASVIDGIRLCKAKRFRYKNSDMANLEEQLRAASDCRTPAAGTRRVAGASSSTTFGSPDRLSISPNTTTSWMSGCDRTNSHSPRVSGSTVGNGPAAGTCSSKPAAKLRFTCASNGGSSPIRPLAWAPTGLK